MSYVQQKTKLNSQGDPFESPEKLRYPEFQEMKTGYTDQPACYITEAKDGPKLKIKWQGEFKSPINKAKNKH